MTGPTQPQGQAQSNPIPPNQQLPGQPIPQADAMTPTTPGFGVRPPGAAPTQSKRGRPRGGQQTAWTDETQLEDEDRLLNPARKRAALTIVALVFGVAAGLTLDQYYLRRILIALLALIVACGLNILVGHTGQVSLGNIALYAIGGYVAAWATTYWGLPPLAGLPLGALAAGVAGLAIGAPALRLRGAYLALATLGFGLIVYKATDALRQTNPKYATVTPPSITIGGLSIAPDQQLYYFALIITIVILWVTRSLTWSSTGRRLMAVRDSEPGAASVGISVYRYKLGAFFFTALTAGLAGAMYNYVDQLINPSTFETVQSVRMLFVLVIGGLGTAISGPFLGAGLIFLLQLLAESYQQAENLALAVVLLLVVWFLPRGIAGTIGETRFIRWLPRPYETYTILSRGPGRLPALGGTEPATPPPIYASPRGQRRHMPEIAPGGDVLIVDNALKHFGGVKAVDGVSIRVPQGGIHAIMGPNGSGKSTTLDLIAGSQFADSGRVIINGTDVTRWPAHKREQAGLARTFQNIQLFKELPVIWNVAAAIPPNSSLAGQMFHTPKAVADEIRIHGDALAILEEWDLTYLTFRKAGVCSYGQQKMIELARAAATKPDILLVDEPSTGLNPRWIAGMVQALAKINAQGTTLLLIEHHQAVIGDLAQRVTVLDQGQVIAEGTFDEVRAQPQVQMVYLGEVHESAPTPPTSELAPTPVAALPAQPAPQPATYAQSVPKGPPQPMPPPVAAPPPPPPPPPATPAPMPPPVTPIAAPPPASPSTPPNSDPMQAPIMPGGFDLPAQPLPPAPPFPPDQPFPPQQGG